MFLNGVSKFLERGGVGYGGRVVERCFSPPHYNIYLRRNNCNRKCLNTGIGRAKPRLKALISHIFMRNFSSVNRVKLFAKSLFHFA